MPAFFAIKSESFATYSAFNQSNNMRAVLEGFSMKFINENVGIINHASGIQVLDCSKSTVYWKNYGGVIIADAKSSSNFLDVVVFPLSSCVTGPSFMLI